MKEYQKYEYCIDTKCVNIIDNKPFSKKRCSICEAYLFHKYIQKKGYKIIKEEEPYCGAVDNLLNGVN